MENYTFIVIGLLVAAFAFFIIKDKKKKPPTPAPTVTPSSTPPVVIDGVYIGERTYTDVAGSMCANVVSVIDGVVKFSYTNDPNSVNTMFVQQFKDAHYHTPDGCGNDVSEG